MTPATHLRGAATGQQAALVEAVAAACVPCRLTLCCQLQQPVGIRALPQATNSNTLSARWGQEHGEMVKGVDHIL